MLKNKLNKYKKWILCAGMVVVSLSLSGCEKQKNMRTISFVSFADPMVYQSAIRAFERENPDVRVTLQHIPWSGYSQRLLTSFAGGSSTWDVIEGVDVLHFYPLMIKGLVEPLDGHLSKGDVESFYPTLIDRFSKDGHLYAVPSGVNVQNLFINTELLNRNGYSLSDQITWMDLEKLANKKTEEMVRNKQFLINITHSVFSIIPAFGSAFADDPNEPRKATMYTPDTIDGVTLWRRMFRKGAFPTLESGDTSTFEGGQIMMKIGFSTMAAEFHKAGTASIPFEVRPNVTGLPGKSTGVRTQTGLMVTANSKNKELAAQFALFLNSSKGLRYRKESSLSPRIEYNAVKRSQFAEWFGRTDAVSMLEQELNRQAVRPLALYWSEFAVEQESLQENFILNDEMSPSDFLSRLNIALQKALDRERVNTD